MTHETAAQDSEQLPVTAEGESPAATYDVDTNEAGWDSPERAQKLVEAFVTDGAKVLDIGIGTAQAVQGYQEKGATIIGLDHDQAMLDEARAVIGDSASLRLSDINEPLPIEDLRGQIDVAQAVGVLEFAEDIKNIVEQVRDALKNNGVLVFTVETPAETSAGDNETVHYPETGITVHRHSANEIRTLLKGSGLTLLQDEAYGGYERGDGNGEKVPYHIFLAQKKS